MEKQKITGIIERKETNEKSGPIGFYYVSSLKFVCWSQTIWNKFNEGDEVEITYVTIEKESNGRVYKNNSISLMRYLSEPEPTFSKTEKELLEEVGVNTDKLQSPNKVLKSENGVFKLGGLNYRIKSIELELIQNA